ncbi:MAG: hypothetical protein ACRCWU_01505 [Metamycoplasmataceae bacterium]
MDKIHFIDNAVLREDLYLRGKSMRTRNIVGIVLWFTIIGIIPSLIISLVDSIIILSTDFRNKELNDDKLLWGLLSLLLLGNIGCLIFASKMMSIAEHGSASSFETT